ncbi:MAG TPA: copper transporter [Armatimonadota bacterium]|jgi:hypothetical protein
MIDYRTYLTGLVAVFLALGLGMLVGAALVGSPSTVRQQKELRTLQKSFTEFQEQNSALRSTADDVRARLMREDSAMRELMPRFVDGRLAGRRVAIVLCGQMDDTAFLANVNEALSAAGATVSSTTRVPDDWLPTDEGRDSVASAFGVPRQEASDAKLGAALGYAVAAGHADQIAAAADAAAGLRLEGDYSKPVHAALLITGATTEERQTAARLGLTPESGVLNGLAATSLRVVAAEPDGEERFSVLPMLFRKANATVDHINLAAGQLSAVFGLAGRDGHFGLKRSAERAIPEMP